MSARTLARGTTFAFGSGFGIAPNMFRKDSGVLVVERLAMFRSGTFRDSTGYQQTWETLHMKQIIDNYEHLSEKKIFTDVPVRDGHKGWLVHDLPGNGQVFGYHQKIWTEKLTAPHDDTEYDYILADIEVTDPAYAAKIENGTLRNRSAEIGMYVTNDEAEFWPVYMGVAYVDIPAVEGLRFSGNQSRDPQVYVFMNSPAKETGVTVTQTPAGQPQVPAAPLMGVPQPVQSYSINGATVSDPVAVQNHILALEQFRSETSEANRTNFVNGLAAANKILAAQVPSMIAFATALSPESYTAWVATFEVAPEQSVLGQHVSGVTNATGQAATPTPADAQVETDLGIVKMHRQAGTPAKQLEGMASYKRLLAAGKLPA